MSASEENVQDGAAPSGTVGYINSTPPSQIGRAEAVQSTPDDEIPPAQTSGGSVGDAETPARAMVSAETHFSQMTSRQPSPVDTAL